jgi:hypothetical protein
MSFYGWSEDYVRFGISSAIGWVFYNFAMEETMSVWGAVYERKTDGYIKQEANKILNHG